MRKGTSIMLGVLLVAIMAAAIAQFVFRIG